MFKKRLLNLALILPLTIAVCTVAYKLGPGSSGRAEPAPAGSAEASPPQPAAANESPNSQLFDLFGMYQTALAKGRVKSSPEKYLDSIEVIYRSRGYSKVDYKDRRSKGAKVGAPGSRPNAGKFFQREKTDGICSLSAIGNDADYSSENKSGEPYSFTILVVPAEDGIADWATYRMEIDRHRLEKFSNLGSGDFPGTDPANIPRLPGLQRIYALSSARGAISIYRSSEPEAALIVHYMDEMPKYGWRFEPTQTLNANKTAAGVMCFTRGANFSMIWITPNKDTGTTNVTVSAH